MEPLQVDSRILSLAAEVTESPDQDVPVLLLKIKGILTSVPPGSKESQKIKQDLYYYDLVQYCLSVLKQDYTRVLGGWATAVHIAEILSLCCVGLEVKEEPEEFYNKLLPSAVDNLLFLGRRLQVRCIRAIKDEDRREFLHCFRTVTDAICWLSAGHSHLADNVLQNEHFLQLLMADDVETSSGMMSVLQNILRINRGVLLQVAEKTLHCILDELVYKLSSTVNPVIGSAVVKLLLSVAESDSQLVTTLTTRYKGLETLLSKQWAGRGFDTNLDQLLDLLRLENNKTDKTQRLHHAVCIIQAAWRGFQTRKRLKQLPKAVTTLQKNFRAKREQELQQLRKQKEEESLLQQLQLQRQRAMRRFHERQLTLLEIVHAGQVDKHMREMEDKSAVTIQRHWRAFRARKKFLQQKQSLKQYRAAVIIQKAVLKFLEKQRKRKAYSLWKPPKALSDEQKLSLQEKVKDYIKLHSASEMSEEMSRELHQQAQEKLAHYVMKRSLDRKTQQHREALLAQIHTYVDQLMVCNSVYLCDTPLKMPNTDAGEMLGTRSIRPRPHSLENPQQPVESGRESLRQYIESAPSLAEATTEDLNVYMSRSVPVVAKAKQCHYSMLKYSQWPWWKKLGEEFLDDEGVSEDLLCAEVGTLFIGGTKS